MSTEKELQKYREENNRLLRYVMLPAYEQLSDGLFLLMSDDPSRPVGLCHKPQGREYYEWLTKGLTGSERSMEEIKAMLYTRFDKSYRLLSRALNCKLSSNSSLLSLQATKNAEMEKTNSTLNIATTTFFIIFSCYNNI